MNHAMDYAIVAAAAGGAAIAYGLGQAFDFGNLILQGGALAVVLALIIMIVWWLLWVLNAKLDGIKSEQRRTAKNVTLICNELQLEEHENDDKGRKGE